MKTIGTFIVMAIITFTLANASIGALYRSIYQGGCTYQGCTVVDQIGNTLIIELDELDPTDTGCEQAERLIGRIMADGYDVKIRAEKEGWIPFPALRE